MKTQIKHSHIGGEPGSVANVVGKSLFATDAMHEVAVRDNRPKTSTVLRAAAQVFAEQGYQAATIDAIAERAGIAKGTVYLYFHSKHELFFRVFDDYIAAIERIGRQTLERTSLTAASQIQDSIHTLLATSTQTRDLFPLILEFWSASAFPQRDAQVAASFRRAYSKFRMLIANQIRRGQREGEFDPRADASQAAAMLLGALDGTILQVLFDPGLDPVSIGDQFVTVLLHSLAAPEMAEEKLQPERGVD
ncbi:MAG TPA: TetR/AcrR family transcriptional regulator [Candidatus Acidoferrales bacterium]|jgi:AcrR family transcriptional regulator|nr:TetR/AcrR family transcriptional regulator [Candidatus Acidoferrales bacterium]